MLIRFIFILITLSSLLTACSTHKPIISDSAPTVHPDNIELTPDAVPKDEPKSRGGNPSSYEVFGKTYYVLSSSVGFSQQGMASWYGTKFHGNNTSNGEIYDMYAMTAAHKTLPIPTYVEVTNLSNGKKIIVRVNDRGPFHGGRVIDLSYAAAAKLGTLKSGTSPVAIRAINASSYNDLDKQTTQTSISTPSHPLDTTRPMLAHKGLLFIQVGAFESLDNAIKLKNKLIEVDITNIVITTDNSSTSPLYRVQVGPYINISQADPIRVRLHQIGFVEAHFMPHN
ncbi:MAG: septal ring lytic transglycosylase RlpA family lipoprotein [Cycloclasticus sp.]|nr:MAG: septal ring lytic transglycosylase RlpA family lipoprotein [Cycloclasticus sp.]